jgi:hypothetical protein
MFTNLSLDPIQNQMNQFHSFLPFTPRSSKWSLPFCFSYQYFVCISRLSHACCHLGCKCLHILWEPLRSQLCLRISGWFVRSLNLLVCGRSREGSWGRKMKGRRQFSKWERVWVNTVLTETGLRLNRETERDRGTFMFNANCRMQGAEIVGNPRTFQAVSYDSGTPIYLSQLSSSRIAVYVLLERLCFFW